MNRQHLLSICLSTLIPILMTGPAFAQNSVDQTKANTYDKIQKELTHRNVSLNVKQTPFREVINLFRQKATFNIVLSKEAGQMLHDGASSGETSNRRADGMFSKDADQRWDASEQSRETVGTNEEGASNQPSVNSSVTITMNDVRLGQALKTILDQKRMTAVVTNGVVKIVPESYARSFDTRFYDVRDLLHGINDFRAPVLRLQNQSGSSGSKELGVEFDADLFEAGDQSEGKKPLSNRDEITKLVRRNVGNGGWERGGDIRIYSGVMVVRQAPDVHREISHFLKRLRQFR